MYPATNTMYELQVRPRGRSSADEYYHSGATWIEGREGSTYTIYVRNNSAVRIEAVISVDGLDVLQGKPAGVNSRGYVINPNSSVEIPGWKLNNREAAEFYFSRKHDSYVTQINGDVSNTGVIGVMIFSEQVLPNWLYPGAASATTYSTNTAMSPNVINVSASIAGAGQYTAHAVNNLGTGFGNAVDYSTHGMTFNRQNPSTPDAVMVVYYDTADALKRMGIQLRTKRYSSTPNPFPAGGTDNGCVPPLSWVK
jgi:hypothetical protein